MKFNGNITLNALGQSEIQNLVIERLSATPTFSASEAGRLIYNTTSRLFYMNSGLGWVALSTGGDAAALQSETDAIETSIGDAITGSGSFNSAAFTGTNIVTASSITDAINKLDAAISGKNELSELLDVALGAVGAGQFLRYDSVTSKWVNHTLVLANVTDVTLTAAQVNALPADITAAVGVETTARVAADAAEVIARDAAIGVEATARDAAIGVETTRATTAEGTLTTNLAAEVTRATGVETTIAGNLDTEEARALAAEVVLQTAITAEASLARTNESALQTTIDAEVTRATAADTTHTSAIAAETTARQNADIAHDTAISNEVARATARENTIESDFNARVQGLSWKNPVRVASTSDIADLAAVTVVDGVTLVDGDRVLLKNQTVATQNGIYTFTLATTTLARASDMDVAAEFASATFYVSEGTTQADLGYTQIAEVITLGTDAVTFVQFNGAGSVTAGDGMTQVGNVINVGSADSSITVGPDSIQVSAALQTSISQNTANISTETSRATAAEGLLDTAIQQEATDRGAAITAEVAARIADVDVEEARAIAAEGVLQANINSEASRATTAEGTNATAITAETTRATTAEGTLTTNLAGEVTRATAAEAANATAIAGEITRATDAEGVLATADTAEAAARVAGDAAITNQVAKGYFLYTGATATSHIVTHNVGSKYCNVTVIDSATDEQIIPQSVVFDTATQLTVTFNVTLACKVVVMGLGV